jgi:hypothetical protein
VLLVAVMRSRIHDCLGLPVRFLTSNRWHSRGTLKQYIKSATLHYSRNIDADSRSPMLVRRQFTHGLLQIGNKWTSV